MGETAAYFMDRGVQFGGEIISFGRELKLDDVVDSDPFALLIDCAQVAVTNLVVGTEGIGLDVRPGAPKLWGVDVGEFGHTIDIGVGGDCAANVDEALTFDQVLSDEELLGRD